MVKKKHDEILDQLRKKFAQFSTRALQGISPTDFQYAIESRIGIIDAQSEGYEEKELKYQRDLSVKYHWGHDHDFGNFKIKGRMGERHINLLANFIDLFPVSPDDFNGKDVLDIGCWTGGTSLLLAALGSNVFAIEEVNKYAETVSFLSESFGLTNKISVQSSSLYNCNLEEFHGKFDIAYFPGVIYHLSDPVLALRILYNSLKIGGFIVIESAGINSQEPLCRFEGSGIYHTGSQADAKENLNRGGWNWFLPSPSALSRMMREAGFEEIQTQWHNTSNRLYGFGRKVSQTGICKAGLSITNIN